MPFLRKAQIMPVKGISFSIPSTFLPDGYHFPRNMVYNRAELHKRPGNGKLGSVSLGAQPVLHMAVFETSTNLTYLLRHTKVSLQRYNTSSEDWDDFTGVPPLPNLTGSNTDFYSSAVVPESDMYIYTQYLDAPRKFTDSGQPGALLGGSPPNARFVEYVTPYVLFANVNEGGTEIPTKVIWSDTGDPENYTSGNTGSVLLTDEPSAIRGMKKLADFAMVYKESSVYRGRKVATSSIFDFGGPFSVGKGLYSGRAIADADGVHYYMGLNDFYANDATRIQSIGAPVREYIFPRLNRDKNTGCHAIHVEELKEVWFYIVITGQDYPTELWKYKYELDFWYQDDVDNVITATMYKVINAVTWDDAPGLWSTQTANWDDVSGQASSPIPTFGNDDGFTRIQNSLIVDDDGSAVIGYFETKDFSGVTHQGIEYDTRFMQLDLWASGNSITVYYSTDYGDSWTSVETRDLTSDMEKHTFWFDIISTKIRFKFEAAGKTDNFRIRAFQPYYLSNAEIPNNA